MLTDFNLTTPEPTHTSDLDSLFSRFGWDLSPTKHKRHKKKAKKGDKKRGSKKALRQDAEDWKASCAKLAWTNGYLAAENDMLKRLFQVATSVSQHKFNDALASDVIDILPPPRKQ